MAVIQRPIDCFIHLQAGLLIVILMRELPNFFVSGDVKDAQDYGHRIRRSWTAHFEVNPSEHEGLPTLGRRARGRQGKRKAQPGEDCALSFRHKLRQLLAGRHAECVA
jgi:hypothetical protein